MFKKNDPVAFNHAFNIFCFKEIKLPAMNGNSHFFIVFYKSKIFFN